MRKIRIILGLDSYPCGAATAAGEVVLGHLKQYMLIAKYHSYDVLFQQLIKDVHFHPQCDRSNSFVSTLYSAMF
jgi:hypothetical protein